MKVRLPLDIPTIDGYITSQYAPRTLPGIDGDFHWGIDLGRVPRGSPVYAIDEGTVEYVDLKGSSTGGLFVRIGHTGYQSRYLHLDSITVKVLQPICT